MVDLKKLFEKQGELEETWYPEDGMVRICSFVSKFRMKRGACVLNIGPRTGSLLPILKRKVRKEGKIIALDDSYEILKKAKKKRSKVPTLHIQANVEHIPLPDDSCDYVICFSIFPSFMDKKKAFLEMTRVLKNEGKILIAHIVRFKAGKSPIYCSFDQSLCRLYEPSSYQGLTRSMGMISNPPTPSAT